MDKKTIILSSIVLAFIAIPTFFYNHQNQQDVRDLNKDLSKGVKVVKSFIGNKYKVVNNLDEYEFKVPEEWGGLYEIEYYHKKEGCGVVGLSVQGVEHDFDTHLAIKSYLLLDPYISLDEWVEKEKIHRFDEISWEKEELTIADYKTIKLVENEQIGSWYFLKNDKRVYEIGGTLDDVIQYIIINGKW